MGLEMIEVPIDINGNPIAMDNEYRIIGLVEYDNEEGEWEAFTPCNGLVFIGNHNNASYFAITSLDNCGYIYEYKKMLERGRLKTCDFKEGSEADDFIMENLT